jgi:Uma2 family endonuclease
MFAVEQSHDDQYHQLQNVPWTNYLEVLETRPNFHFRITYDHGHLEMLIPSAGHERFDFFLGRLIDAWTEELSIDVQNYRTLTLKREELLYGLDPDNCYYIAHEAAIRNKEEIDFAVDPPPDLAIEIDLGGSAMDKLEIYAAFGVPEVWRYDGDNLFIYLFDSEDKSGSRYRESSGSQCLPGFPIREVAEVMQKIGSMSDTELVRKFRQLVRKP